MAQLSGQEIEANSMQIATTAMTLLQLREACSVFVYVSRTPEVETMQLLLQLLHRGCEVSVPLILDDADGGSLMQAVHIDGVGQLRPGRFGIMAPPAANRRCHNPDVVLVPGLAFDSSGGRLGQGAGYYDGWFAANHDSCRIGLAHSLQLVQKVPVEQHDMRMHFVVTEQGKLQC